MFNFDKKNLAFSLFTKVWSKYSLKIQNQLFMNLVQYCIENNEIYNNHKVINNNILTIHFYMLIINLKRV